MTRTASRSRVTGLSWLMPIASSQVPPGQPQVGAAGGRLLQRRELPGDLVGVHGARVPARRAEADP